MATRNLIPRGSGEGGLGIETTPWGTAFFNSGNFVSGMTIGGNPVPTGFDIGGGGGAVIEGDDDNINFGGTDPADTRDINFMQGGENVMIINEEGNVNIENNMNVSGTISGVSGIFDERVGIGTTDPQAKFNVSHAATIAGTNLANASILVGRTADGIGIDDNEIVKKGGLAGAGADLNIVSQGVNGIIKLKTGADSNNNNEPYHRMIIASDGHVGIGTTSPDAQLHIEETTTGGISAGAGRPGAVLRLTHNAQWESAYNVGGSNPDFLGGIEFESTDTSAGTGVRAAIKTTVDHYANINSLAFYTASSGATPIAERMRIDSDGNVGIGTTTPNDTLPLTLKSIASGATGIQFDDGDGNWNMVVDGDNMRFQQGTSGSNPIERMRIDSDGNVGIGTSNPNARLEIKTRETDELVLRLMSDNENSLVDVRKYDNGDTVFLNTYYDSASGGLSGDFLFKTTDNAAGATKNTRMIIKQGGNVGIGTSIPLSDFVVYGGTDNTASSFEVNCGNDVVLIDALQRSNSNTPSPIRYSAESHAFLGSTGGSGGEGNVGIGTADPMVIHHISTKNDSAVYAVTRFTADTQSFDVGVGGSNVPIEGLRDKFYIYNSSQSVSSGPKLVINSNGQVGIGTTDPGAKLNVYDSTQGISKPLKLTNQSTNNTSGRGVGVDFQHGTFHNNVLTLEEGSYIYSILEGNDNQISALTFGTSNGGDPSEKMRIDSNGNVGIGTRSPTGKLEVYTENNNTGSTYGNLADSLLLKNTSDMVGAGPKLIFYNANNPGSPSSSPSALIGLQRVNNANHRGDLVFHTRSALDPEERMRIDSNGNVGIGTTNPTALLEVGDGTGAKVIKIKSGGGSSGDLVFDSASDEGIVRYEHTSDSMRFHTNGSEQVRIDSDGNVGIGTTDPLNYVGLFGSPSTLTLGGAKPSQLELGFNPTVYSNFVTGTGGLAFMNYSNSSTSVGAGAKLVGGIYCQTVSDTITSNPNQNAGGRLRFFTKPINGAPTEKMRIDDAGNVGIGTTNPQAKFNVSHGATIGGANLANASILVGSTGNGIGIDDNEIVKRGGVAGAGADLNIASQGVNGIIKLKTGAASNNNNAAYDRMIIDSDGSVGIGTMNPSAVFECKKNATGPVHLGRFTNANGQAIVQIRAKNDNLSILEFADSEDGNVGAINYNHAADYMRFKTSDVERVAIDSSGRVGIGTMIPGSYKLKVQGNLHATGTITSSDDRVKHNEQAIIGAIETLGKITPKKYIKTTEMYEANHDFELDAEGNPVDENGEPVEHSVEAGVIAQQVLQVPELAFMVNPEDVDKDGNVSSPHGLNYNSLFTYAIAAIQELKSEIESLKLQINPHDSNSLQEPKTEQVAEETIVEEPASEEVTEEVSEESSEAVSLGASISSASLDEISDLRAEESTEN